ncbi:MAG TPA: DUF6268 family outer membrane beta-barrel protein [Desulfuromonadaceae bacterium]
MKLVVPLGALCAVLTLFPVAFAAASTVSQELDLEAGAVAGSSGNQGIGPARELSTDIRYVISPPITNDLFLRLGAEWERFAFSAPRTGALPDVLQHVNAVIGFDYQLADQWLMRIELQPGLYGDLRQPGWREMDAPFIIGLAYLRSADLQWFFGLRIEARSQLPVLPALGVRWQMDDSWTLDLQLPQPRLEYGINDRHQAYLGAGVKAGTFTVDEHFGNDHGNPRLNGATIDYAELRLGAGWSWKVVPSTTIEAEAGYVPWRTWDFFDQGVLLHSRPAPYLQLGCHVRF